MAMARRAVPISQLVARSDRPALAFLLATLTIEVAFFVVLGPLLPDYASTLHLSKLGAGVLTASYAGGCVVAAIPVTVVAGRIGARMVTIAGLALVGLACGGFALAHSAAALDLARVAQGVGAAALWAGAFTWLLAIGGDTNRGRLIGVGYAAAGLGACVGPAIGALADLTGPRPVFLALAAAILALGCAGAAIASRGGTLAGDRDAGGMGAALRHGDTWRALLLVALPSVGYGVANVLVPLRLHALGASAAVIAGCFIVASAVEMQAGPLTGTFYDRRGAATVLRVTLGATAACALAFAAGPPLGLLLALVVISWPLIGAAWVPALAELTSATERVGAGSVLALGLFNLFWAIGQTVAGVGGGALARSWEAAPFLVLAGLYGLAALSARRLASR